MYKILTEAQSSIKSSSYPLRWNVQRIMATEVKWNEYEIQGSGERESTARSVLWESGRESGDNSFVRGRRSMKVVFKTQDNKQRGKFQLFFSLTLFCGLLGYVNKFAFPPQASSYQVSVVSSNYLFRRTSSGSTCQYWTPQGGVMLTHRKCLLIADSCRLKLAEWHIDPPPPRIWLVLGNKMRAWKAS